MAIQWNQKSVQIKVNSENSSTKINSKYKMVYTQKELCNEECCDEKKLKVEKKIVSKQNKVTHFIWKWHKNKTYANKQFVRVCHGLLCFCFKPKSDTTIHSWCALHIAHKL